MTEYEKALDAAFEAVNVLGAPDSACTTDAEREYCRGISDVLEAIEALKLQDGTKEVEKAFEVILADSERRAEAVQTTVDGFLAQLRRPYNGFLSPDEAGKI